jgi:cation:H+ antiporter
MVIGAEGLAVEFGMSEGLVGLTILALGTSLPELGTVIASARRGRNDLVLGNVLGSNMFNSLGVAGMSGLLGGGALAANFRPDLVMMIAIAAFAGVAAMTGDRFNRVEGALMLSAYPVAIWLAL